MSAVAQPQPLQVTAIRLGTLNSGHEGITHIMAGNQLWTTRQVIDELEYYRRVSFYTSVGGKVAWVGVRTNALGHKYIQTYADGYWNNNLLALPRC